MVNITVYASGFQQEFMNLFHSLQHYYNELYNYCIINPSVTAADFHEKFGRGNKLEEKGTQSSHNTQNTYHNGNTSTRHLHINVHKHIFSIKTSSISFTETHMHYVKQTS